MFAYTAYAGFAPFFLISLLAIIGIRRSLEQEVESPKSDLSLIQVFYFSKRFIKIYLITGISLIAAEIITRIWIRFPNSVASIGVVMIIVAVTMRNSVIIKIFPDCFTYKPGPLASEKRIYFSNITEVSTTKKKLTLKLTNSKRPQQIMMEILNPSDRLKFSTYFENNLFKAEL